MRSCERIGTVRKCKDFGGSFGHVRVGLSEHRACLRAKVYAVCFATTKPPMRQPKDKNVAIVRLDILIALELQKLAFRQPRYNVCKSAIFGGIFEQKS